MATSEDLKERARKEDNGTGAPMRPRFVRGERASHFPVRLRFHLHDRGVGAGRDDVAGLCEKAVLGLAYGLGDGVVVIE
jgi:hypothetical protein